MMMRFRGDGVGHKMTRQATQCLSEDRDPLDKLDQMQDWDDEEEEETVQMDVDPVSGDLDSDSDEQSATSDGESESSDVEGREPLDEYDVEGYAEF